jgi:hypothetical protein
MIKADYRISFKEYHSAVSRLTYRRLMARITMLCGMLFFIHFVYVLASRQLFAIFDIAMVVFCFCYYPIVIYFSAKKNFKTTKGLSSDTTVTISETGITTENEIGTSKLNWMGIYKIIEVKEMLLFYQSNNIAVFVPKKALGDIEKVKALIIECYQGKIQFKS